METLGEKEGRKRRRETDSPQVISEDLCEVCKGPRPDEGLSTYLQLQGRARGKMCNGRNRTQLRRTGENLKIQAARHMWLWEYLRLEQAKHH